MQKKSNIFKIKRFFCFHAILKFNFLAQKQFENQIFCQAKYTAAFLKTGIVYTDFNADLQVGNEINFEEILKIIGEEYINVVTGCISKSTPLHVANKERQSNMINFLIKIGADESLEDSFQRIPRQWS